VLDVQLVQASSARAECAEAQGRAEGYEAERDKLVARARAAHKRASRLDKELVRKAQFSASHD
jgi:hypothetical protein